jgi:hypothetical protein
MNLTLTTPALLFSTISLLLLAYTNRFLAIANLVRGLHTQYQSTKDKKLINQINNLRTRIALIRDTQTLGVLSLLFCVLCMFLLFTSHKLIANYVFGGSLVLLMWSLALSTYENYISTNALRIQLSDLAEEVK